MDKNLERINRLKRILHDFHHAKHNYERGKNSGIRNNASREMDSLISEAKSIIMNNDDLNSSYIKMYEFDGGDFNFFNDEFFDWNYFGKDLNEFLALLEDGKI